MLQGNLRIYSGVSVSIGGDMFDTINRGTFVPSREGEGEWQGCGTAGGNSSFLEMETIVHLQIHVEDDSTHVHKDHRGRVADPYSGKRGAGHWVYI